MATVTVLVVLELIGSGYPRDIFFRIDPVGCAKPFIDKPQV